MQNYDYDPLAVEHEEIRLIVVSRRAEKAEPLICELITRRLDDVAGDFIAVSHVWGKDEHTITILLNQQPFFVSPQVGQFLNLASMREPGRAMWIDAICVDQQNGLEKASQIPLMQKIYTSARRLIAFLPSPVDPCHHVPNIFDSFKTSPSSTRDAAPDMSLFDSTLLLALIRLLFHEYWSRLWIVQELRLSGEKEFWWEGIMVPGAQMEIVASTALSCANGDPSALQERLWEAVLGKRVASMSSQARVSLLDHVDTTSVGACRFSHPDPDIDLATIVLKHSAFRSTEREDRVYALLGLIRKRDKIDATYGLTPIDMLALVVSLSPTMKVTGFEAVSDALGVDWRQEIVFPEAREQWLLRLWDLLFALDSMLPGRFRKLSARVLWPEVLQGLKYHEQCALDFDIKEFLRSDENVVEPGLEDVCFLWQQLISLWQNPRVYYQVGIWNPILGVYLQGEVPSEGSWSWGDSWRLHAIARIKLIEPPEETSEKMWDVCYYPPGFAPGQAIRCETTVHRDSVSARKLDPKALYNLWTLARTGPRGIRQVRFHAKIPTQTQLAYRARAVEDWLWYGSLI